jgi:hypothetical protein
MHFSKESLSVRSPARACEAPRPSWDRTVSGVRMPPLENPGAGWSRMSL